MYPAGSLLEVMSESPTFPLTTLEPMPLPRDLAKVDFSLAFQCDEVQRPRWKHL